MYEIYLNVNDLSLNCCLQTGYLSIRPLRDFRPLGTLRGTLPTIHCALTTNLASGLATNPLGHGGFGAYQQYGRFCDNSHNFTKLKN